MILCRSVRNAEMQRAYGRTSFSARGYLGTHKTSTKDMGKHVAIKKGAGAVKCLHVLDEAARYRSDHNPLLWHIAYKAPCDTHTHTSFAASDARIRYDVQKAEAYQACLATELQQHFNHSFSKSLMLMSCVTGLKHA